MKLISKYLLLIVAITFVQTAYSQLDSILTPDGIRKFIVHLPKNYSSIKKYPLVLNYHGLGSNAAQQQVMANMDGLSDTEGFIVVYPEGIGANWQLDTTATPNDVQFTSLLIDALIKRHSIDTNCIYATGFSQGGFMTYVLGCYLSQRIKAIAPVSGNMVVTTQLTCNPTHGMPVLHIHGDADYIVNYNGTFGITSVPKTVLWWAIKNKCDTVNPTFIAWPNYNLNDSTTTDVVQFKNGIDGSTVIHYKVNGGGHTWPGSFINLFLFGKTSYDFSASTQIWNFFKAYCSSQIITSVNSEKTNPSLNAYPIPASSYINITNSELIGGHYTIYNLLGKALIQSTLTQSIMDIESLPDGTYFLMFDALPNAYKFIKSSAK